MRKLLWLGLATIVLGCAVGLWLSWLKWPDRNFNVATTTDRRVSQSVPGGGEEGEASDVIEPLVVDRGGPLSAPPSEPVPDAGPMPRVALTSGMKQPPRPDAEPGQAPRMPYADETEILDLAKDPVMRILESSQPKVNIFDEIEKENTTEESEPKEPDPPVIDPHYQHCPYHGGCPAPYPYRTPSR